MKMANTNTVEKKLCRAILYIGTTNNELNKLIREHSFTFAVGKVRVAANRDFASLQQEQTLTKKKK